MRAIDTNVVVRLLIGDDEKQTMKARAAIAESDIFIATTVLLETEWVLRVAYGYTPNRIAAVLRALGGVPGVMMEDPIRVGLALDWMESGMDFADALHLAYADGCSAFLTFDRKLGKAAAGRSAVPVELL